MISNLSFQNLKPPSMADQDHHHQETHVDISQHLPQVLILEDLDPLPILKHHGDYLSKKFKLLKAWESSLALDHFLAIHAQSVRALLCSGHYLLTANILRCLPSLQLVVTTSSGLNNIDLPECKRLGIAVANAGNAYAEDVADLAVGLFIDLLRKISSSDGFVRQGLWSTTNGGFPLGSKLGGKRVGIVGLGRIGLEVAKRLEVFGCEILYNSRKQKPFVSYPYYSDVYDLACETDALIICCGLSNQTCNMINKPVMEALGTKGVIVNVGRGGVINEKELVQCLVEGTIGGAGLDVFENEPLVPQELFTLQNVVLSPHRAMFTPESLWSICEVLVGNLENFFSNKPLISQVMDV